MKKTILLMFVMMTLGASYSIAQSNTLIASNFENHESDFTDGEPLEITLSNFSESTTSRSYNIPESASTFKMNTVGQLNINANSTIKYTKAEILSKDSNATKLTLKLNESNKSVDISTLGSGTYYMILSNELGDVFSEKIIIL